MRPMLISRPASHCIERLNHVRAAKQIAPSLTAEGKSRLIAAPGTVKFASTARVMSLGGHKPVMEGKHHG